MNLLFLGSSDYASSGKLLSMGCETRGHSVRCVGEKLHQFDYPDNWEVGHSRREICNMIEEADIVLPLHAHLPSCIRMGDLLGKLLIPIHGGSTYRINPDQINARFRPSSIATIVYTADLLGYGAVNEHLLPVCYPPCLEAEPTYPQWDGVLTVGHFPTNASYKGSQDIARVLRSMQAQGRIRFLEPDWNPDKACGIDHCPWPVQVARMARCDVIVDQIQSEVDGRQFGEWASCAIEAAAMGRIVIANSLRPGPYFDAYGEQPQIVITNHITALYTAIECLCDMDELGIRRMQARTRAWARRHHSIEEAGKHFDGRILGSMSPH